MRNYLKNNPGLLHSPAYYFDLDAFAERIDKVSEALGEIPLTYSIKANPFLLFHLPDQIRFVEVCSPGELKICEHMEIPGKRIIYSGVNKENWDIREAISYGAEIVTAESKRQAALVQEEARIKGKKQKVILRLSSGNQFGMSCEDLLDILGNADKYRNLGFFGLHYYSGTQKKLKQIQKDLDLIDQFLKKAKEQTGFCPQLVEIGPGLTSDYFDPSYEEKEMESLKEAASLLTAFANSYPLGIEMGRFLASSCGTYATRVKDLKENQETHYVICDGGINHLKYFGQNMAMQIPEMETLSGKTEKRSYCICGSLCTTADILVRDVELPELEIEDVILFHRCGAYSVTEGIGLFLSRNLPEVFAYSRTEGLIRLREGKCTSDFNTVEQGQQFT